MSEQNDERGPPLELSDEQRHRAEEALDAVESGEATHALDLLDEWHAGPVHRDLQYLGPAYTDATEGIHEATEWVDLDNVRGISWELHDRFVDQRILRTLRRLLDGEFHPKHDGMKPIYMEIDGDLYVSGDGTNRTIACKAVGVEEIHAVVEHVPGVATTPYYNWMGWPRPPAGAARDSRPGTGAGAPPEGDE